MAASLLDALVVGAGPAGLATSRELSMRGVSHAVLERGDQIGHTWARLYDSLVLHTARGLSALPGLGYPRGTPLFPTREIFLAYLHQYADTFRLPIHTRFDVATLRPHDGLWIARNADGAEVRARTAVVATGIVSNPSVPEFPGRQLFRGRVLHSADYRRPDGFGGHRVLVVGAGNSAGEISVELAAAGAEVTLAVRTGAQIVPREIAGVPIQYLALVAALLPRSAQRAITGLIARASAIVRGPAPLPPPADTTCPKVPLIGLRLADLLRSGSIRLARGIAAFTADGVRFVDGSAQTFDTVLLATGYKPAVRLLEGVIRVDRCGFALRHDRVASVDHPRLYFVGHTYDLRGALFNIGRDARRAAGQLTAALADTSRTSIGTERRPNGR